MNSEKIIGYLLLALGIGIIIASTFSLYQVFTGQKIAPEVFQFEAPTISLPTTQQLQLPQDMELPEGFSFPQAEAQSQEFKVLPDEAINNLSNMFIYLLLMGFIASSGAKIATIGTKMAKDIKVVVKEEKVKQASS